MVSFKGRHRVKRYTIRFKIIPCIIALGEYFVGPLPA